MSTKRVLRHKELLMQEEFLKEMGYKEVSTGTFLIPDFKNVSVEEEEAMQQLMDALDYDFIVKKRKDDK